MKLLQLMSIAIFIVFGKHNSLLETQSAMTVLAVMADFINEMN